MQTMRRIAMWSGPRNISTAMMRSWENRPDTCVVDEPLYAHYLASTRIEHPGLAEILESQNTDWREVTRSLIEDPPEPGCDIYYQKHMTHHQLPNMELDWILKLDNCFLIRDPDAVISSYAQKRPNVTPEDLGFLQQEQLFRFVAENSDSQPTVIESDAFLQSPRKHLEMLCERFELPFSNTMLTWPSGPRDSDGVWAKYWYHNVEKSTGFMPWSERHYDLSDEQKRISDACRPSYEALKTKCLKPE